MPAARGMKRAASKSSSSTATAAPKNKKKRNVIQLEVPTLPRRRSRMLTCGQNDVGQLGLGEDVQETSRFKHVSGLGDKIVDACAGGMHTIAIDSDGKVWTFGCNDEGALGRASSDADEGSPRPVALPLPAVAIAAGDSHSAALLNNGDVYAWGSFRDSHGSMGLVVRGREGKPCREPVKIDIPEPAAAIASGSDHLVVLTTSGSVYTMGCGEQGQLGRLSQRSASRDTRQGFSPLLMPAKVTLKQGASRVWAGYYATVVLDAGADRVYAWGLNNYGQLGITGEKRKTALYAPIEADAFGAADGGGWRSVACGQHHSLALDHRGQVHAIGRVEYGRLGLGERSGDAEKLEPLPKLQNKRVVSIAAGNSNSFAVTDTGEIFAWGMGSEGQLGTGGDSDVAEPAPVASNAMNERTPVHVSAGGQHTVLLVEDPNAIREESPVPEPEREEQKTEDTEEEEPTPVPEKKPKGRANKRQKKQEQEEEVSSTSSGAVVGEIASNTEPKVVKKVNGDEKKETPMEVDETDSKQDKPEEPKDKEAHKETDTTKEQEKTETDNSSQATAHSETEDVEMKQPEAEKPDPTTELDKPESKSDKKSESKTDEKSESKTEEKSESKTEDKSESDSKELNGTPEESKADKVEVKSASVEMMQTEQAVTSA